MFIFLSPEQELIFKETIIVEGWFSLLVNMKIYAHRTKYKKKKKKWISRNIKQSEPNNKVDQTSQNCTQLEK